MRKWTLLLLVGLLFAYLFMSREGVDDTLSPPPICGSGSTFNGTNCLDATNRVSTPTCPSGYYFDVNKCVLGTPPTSDPSRDLDVVDAGPLPTAIDEQASTGDTDIDRPTSGPVFGANGPFSGRLASGQATGMNAAAALTPPDVPLDPYDFWPGTKGSSKAAPPGNTVPVNGPQWGGHGTSTVTASSSSSSRDAPGLYGPGDGDKVGGPGLGVSKKTSMDFSMLPSYQSTGSDPSNRYAGTSRAPGDQDMYASPYVQSTSYSLANGSQKTEPVPYLTDFSAFQN